MWVKRKDYENIQIELSREQEKRAEWEAKYRALTENQVSHTGKALVISSSMLEELLKSGDEAKRKLETLSHELEVWKQKYADEVQKRLALIDQMK